MSQVWLGAKVAGARTGNPKNDLELSPPSPITLSIYIPSYGRASHLPPHHRLFPCPPPPPPSSPCLLTHPPHPWPSSSSPPRRIRLVPPPFYPLSLQNLSPPTNRPLPTSPSFPPLLRTFILPVPGDTPHRTPTSLKLAFVTLCLGSGPRSSFNSTLHVHFPLSLPRSKRSRRRRRGTPRSSKLAPMVLQAKLGAAGKEEGVSFRWVKLDSLDINPVQHLLWSGNEAGQICTRHVRQTSGVSIFPSFKFVLGKGDEDSRRDCGRSINHLGNGVFGSISSSFFRGRGGRRQSKKQNAATASVSMVRFSPERGTYAYDALQRRFKELDKDGVGYISEGDLKVALKRLNLPASEQDLQGFMNEVAGTTKTSRITFEQFAEYAINRENQLLDTFKELDKRKIGYITVDELQAALRKYKFRIADKDVTKMVTKMHVRGGLLGSPDFYNHSQAFDFAEFRDFLMLSTAKDLRDIFEIWGRAVIDLGDIDTSFPMSSGKYNKAGRLGQRRPKIQVFKHLFAGAVAGAVSRTVVAPLERIKVMCMVDSEVASQGLPSILRKIWREEGVGGLFKGNLLNVLRIAPTKAVEFFVYDNLKDYVLRKSERVDISGLERMALGSVASMAGTFITHPVDTVRSVVTVQAAGSQKGIFEVTKSIIENEGFTGLYRGLGPNMIRVAPYGAINFFVYDQLKQWYRKKVGPGGGLGALPTMIFGALAGASAQTVVYPLEMVQRRLQVEAARQGPIVYKNMINAFQVVIREEGVGALYAGLLPNYLKLVPAAAISFLVYEVLKEKLDLN